jgi:hypothetical protein
MKKKQYNVFTCLLLLTVGGQVIAIKKAQTIMLNYEFIPLCPSFLSSFL